VKVVLLVEAQRRFEAEDEWWRENRDATELFIDEFEETLDRLRVVPEIGRIYRSVRGKLIRRLLMKRTRCHIYNFHDPEHDIVEVHTVWGASCGTGPGL
jgi:plasmid stabilization system protein ParE